MANWYVRPDTSHSGTRNGTSYETAWGGWSAITWGASGVNAGDTLYVCGSHAYSATISVGAHTASSEATRVTIRGDYTPDPGSVTFTGGVYLQNDRAYTTIKAIRIVAGTSNCLFLTDTATNCNYENNIFVTSASNAVGIFAATGQDHSDITFSGNTFSGISASTAGTGAAIGWYCDDTINSSLTRITITGNTFYYAAARSVVHFRTHPTANAASKMVDIVITDNVFESCKGVCVELRHGAAVVGRGSGVKCQRNIARLCLESTVTAGTGGMFSLSGFDNSATGGFGDNVVEDNECYSVQGDAGFCNVFYGPYIIQDNVVDLLYTTNIDANGVLFDHEAINCVARRNRFDRCQGKSGVFNSGYAIMVLDATNITCYGNVGKGCKSGIHLGAVGGGQSCSIHNNTFTELTDYGVYAVATSDLANCVVKNNIFTGSGYSVYDASSTSWTGEDYNCFFGFSSGTNNHTLGSNDRSDNPIVDPRGRPTRPQFFSGGVNLAGSDFYGVSFPASPSIGAIQCVGAYPRGNLTSYQVNGNKISIAGRGRR